MPMRDALQGGVLATGIAAPLMVVCCGGGGVAFTAITGAVSGWIGGFGGLGLLLAAAGAALTWRSRRRSLANCCETDAASELERTP